MKPSKTRKEVQEIRFDGQDEEAIDLIAIINKQQGTKEYIPLDEYLESFNDLENAGLKIARQSKIQEFNGALISELNAATNEANRLNEEKLSQTEKDQMEDLERLGDLFFKKYKEVKDNA